MTTTTIAGWMVALMAGATPAQAEEVRFHFNEATTRCEDAQGKQGFNPAFRGPCGDLSHADLEGAQLGGIDLRGASLQGARLRGANLQRARLQGARLFRADLTGANLRGAQLAEAWLIQADLCGARLEGADLQGAHLGAACLEGATFVEAELARAFQEPRLTSHSRYLATVRHDLQPAQDSAAGRQLVSR